MSLSNNKFSKLFNLDIKSIKEQIELMKKRELDPDYKKLKNL